LRMDRPLLERWIEWASKQDRDFETSVMGSAPGAKPRSQTLDYHPRLQRVDFVQ
jgi:hypothetical protein